MPSTVEWANPEKTIVQCRFFESWTVQDYIMAVQQISSLIATVPDQAVDVIHLVQNSSPRPGNLLSTISLLERVVQPNQRLVVFVGLDHFLKTIVNIGKRFVPKAGANVQFADTLDEAYALIAAYSAPSP